MDFYNKAATALDRLDARKGSLKGIVFDLAKRPGATGNDARSISDGKRLLKVTIEVLKYREVLQAILSRTDLLEKEKKAFVYHPSASTSGHSSLRPAPLSLATVLLHDLLFSKRGIALSRQHKLRKAVETHASALKAAKEREKIRRGVQSDAELASDAGAKDVKGKGRSVGAEGEEEGSQVDGKPRWLRINTNRWATIEAVAWFVSAGYSSVDSMQAVLESPSPSRRIFHVDEHVSTLLAFPPHTDLSKLEPYKDGRLIAQDKASCFPAALLFSDLSPDDGGGFDVIDATAAPGNKTTMLSATLGCKGTVWAFERDPKRFETLNTMVAKAGCQNVKTVKGDFLRARGDESRFSKVRRILLDPSCSGSGIVSRLDHLHAPSSSAPDPSRILSLSRFQSLILSHALLHFPHVEQVAYSTCSVWREEDEEVVSEVLRREEVRRMGWMVKRLEGGMEGWRRRGRATEGLNDEETANMIRADPQLDPTIGFFAVVFIRDPPSTSASATAKAIVTASLSGPSTSSATPLGLLSPPASDDEDLAPDVSPAVAQEKRKRQAQTVSETGPGVRRQRRKFSWVRPGRMIRG